MMPVSSSPDKVSKMLRETLQLKRDVQLDRSHRTPVSRKPGDHRSRVTVAKLHYNGDAMDILKRAREKAPLTYNGEIISIFPDYTARVRVSCHSFKVTRDLNPLFYIVSVLLYVLILLFPEDFLLVKKERKK